MSPNSHYLVDQNNIPFLIVGDKPQGMISRLSEKQIDDFFADYTWSFASGWKYYIDTPGAAQVTISKDFFSGLPWQDLVPDHDHSVVTAGLGNYEDLQTPISISDYVTTSRTPDGSFVIAYMPTARTIAVNMASLKAPASAKWFDPTNGAYRTIPGQPFANSGTRQFTPPGNNQDGDGDWVLLLDASR